MARERGDLISSGMILFSVVGGTGNIVTDRNSMLIIWEQSKTVKINMDMVREQTLLFSFSINLWISLEMRAFK